MTKELMERLQRAARSRVIRPCIFDDAVEALEQMQQRIEELEAEARERESLLQSNYVKRSKLQADNERLRAALQRYADMQTTLEMGDHELTEFDEDCEGVYDTMILDARAAVQESDDD